MRCEHDGVLDRFDNNQPAVTSAPKTFRTRSCSGVFWRDLSVAVVKNGKWYSPVNNKLGEQRGRQKLKSAVVFGSSVYIVST